MANETATKKTARKKPEMDKPDKNKVAKKSEKRKPNPAFMRPILPSAPLGAVIGTKPLPRSEVTKKLWQYIKKNGLQDKDQRTVINADAKLMKVFGGKSRVTMFEMTKHVNKHLKEIV